MTSGPNDATMEPILTAAGLSGHEIEAWRQASPAATGEFGKDCAASSAYWGQAERLLERLPRPPQRNERERAAAGVIQEAARVSRVRFLRSHVDTVYDRLTGGRSRFVRVEHLVTQAAEVVPGLVPSARQIAAEDGCLQGEKSGLEIDQGYFVSAVLGSERSGRHLCQAMLLPLPEAQELLPRFQKEGLVELPGASVERAGKAAIVTQKHPRFLNAEDETTLNGAEVCVDLALWIRPSKSRSCAVVWSSVRSTRGGECSAPAST